MAFHPRSDAIILAAGDKAGRLGLWQLDHESFEVLVHFDRQHCSYRPCGLGGQRLLPFFHAQLCLRKSTDSRCSVWPVIPKHRCPILCFRCRSEPQSRQLKRPTSLPLAGGAALAVQPQRRMPALQSHRRQSRQRDPWRRLLTMMAAAMASWSCSRITNTSAGFGAEHC
jgi:hypothetical protein